MGINIYNDEEKQFSKLIKDLKELPKVDAPDNFEFQLMTRIQNNNFERNPLQREKFNLIKFFAPSAVVVTVIILFFVFLPKDEQVEDPLMSAPQQIVSQSTSESDVINSKVENKSGSLASIPKTNTPSQALNADVNPNDAVIKPNSKYPIFNSRSVAVDEYISGENKRRNTFQGNVVKGGEDVPEFDGFFIREEADKNTIERYRAMIDSVKKAQAKADSLKRAKRAE